MEFPKNFPGHLYWTDSQRKVIEMVQLKKLETDNERRRYVVIHKDLQNPQNIVLNPKEGYVTACIVLSHTFSFKCIQLLFHLKLKYIFIILSANKIDGNYIHVINYSNAFFVHFLKLCQGISTM